MGKKTMQLLKKALLGHWVVGPTTVLSEFEVPNVEFGNLAVQHYARENRYQIEFIEYPRTPTRSFHDALVDLILCDDPPSAYQALEAAAVSLMQVAQAARARES